MILVTDATRYIGSQHICIEVMTSNLSTGISERWKWQSQNPHGYEG